MTAPLPPPGALVTQLSCNPSPLSLAVLTTPQHQVSVGEAEEGAP
jgi:hypothetical protein